MSTRTSQRDTRHLPHKSIRVGDVPITVRMPSNETVVRVRSVHNGIGELTYAPLEDLVLDVALDVNDCVEL
jgi:hypothetical protein